MWNLVVALTLVIAQPPAVARRLRVPGAPIEVSYTIDSERANITFLVTLQGLENWIGFGVNRTPWMIGADVVICEPTLGSAQEFLLADRTPDSIQRDSNSAVLYAQIISTFPDVVFAFSRPLKAKHSRDHAINLDGTTTFVWAVGSSPELGYHQSRGAFRLNVITGEARVINVDFAPFIVVHAVFMVAGWGICVPLAIYIAHWHRQNAPFWFHAHRNYNILGFLLSIIGFAFAVANVGPRRRHFAGTHEIIGLVLTAFSVLQLILGWFRPEKSEPKSTGRLVFEYLHKGFGYISLLLVIFNVGVQGESNACSVHRWIHISLAAFGHNVVISVAFLVWAIFWSFLILLSCVNACSVHPSNVEYVNGKIPLVEEENKNRTTKRGTDFVKL